MNIEKQIFEMIQSKDNDYDLYLKMVKFCEKLEKDTKGLENSDFYYKISHLQDSINNAGCEERRSEQIDYMNKVQNEITDKYEDYLY